MRVLLYLASLTLALSCTEAIYNLIKKDFGNELSIFQSSTGDRFKECEKALADSALCFEYFFKEVKDCDDFEIFMELKPQARQVTTNSRSNTGQRPQRFDYDNYEAYERALDKWERRDRDNDDDDDRDSSKRKKFVKLENEGAEYCSKEHDQVSFICEGAGGGSAIQADLSSAIRTIQFKSMNQAYENLHDHCDLDWKPYRN